MLKYNLQNADWQDILKQQTQIGRMISPLTTF